MEYALEHLLREVQQIRQEVQELARRIHSDQYPVEAMLRRRGITTVKHTPRERLVLPPDCGEDAENELYGLMKHYSFRIFLRDLITYARTPKSGLLTRYCSEDAAQRYLAALLHHQIIRQVAPARYEFTVGDAPLFGDTLEWFVARVMEREFASPAAWGIY